MESTSERELGRNVVERLGCNAMGGNTDVFPEQHTELNFQGPNSFKHSRCMEQYTSILFSCVLMALLALAKFCILFISNICILT